MSALRLATQDGAPVPTGEDLHDHFQAPADETKEERRRRLATKRKKAQRARELQAKLKAEAVKVPLELYAGTVAALNQVIAAGGFDGPQAAEEAITLLLHGAADLAARDGHAFAQLIAPPSRRVVADADA
ncbi:TPA: hypothetical protein NHP34_006072 [Pseudomonas aeruginosa]|nr:hypothetical protein [Pseudomonas aeruginosa]